VQPIQGFIVLSHHSILEFSAITQPSPKCLAPLRVQRAGHALYALSDGQQPSVGNGLMSKDHRDGLQRKNWRTSVLLRQDSSGLL
jgi:hypothetical protein